MGTVLAFGQPDKASQRRARRRRNHRCEIVIFPGVRIERHELDLGHRLRKSAGEDQFDGFDGLGGNGRPRKTS